MDLTPDQLAAARVCGCVVTPATAAQVQRLSMQRRIFHVGGEPFVAARDGFFETHGTLAALIEEHRPATPEPSAETRTTPAEGGAPRSDAEPSPAPAEADRNGRPAAAAKPRKPKAPRPEPAPADTDAAPAAETAVGPSDAEEMPAGVAAAQGSGAKARVVGRGRRAGQPPTPRWMVAGKMRRGRLK